MSEKENLIKSMIDDVKSERDKSKRKRKRRKKKKSNSSVPTTNSGIIIDPNNIPAPANASPQYVPIRKQDLSKNRFEQDPAFKDGKKHIDEDKKNAQFAHQKAHRPPQPKVNAKCNGCQKTFSVFYSQLSPAVEPGEINYTCNNCVKNRQGGE